MKKICIIVLGLFLGFYLPFSWNFKPILKENMKNLNFRIDLDGKEELEKNIEVISKVNIQNDVAWSKNFVIISDNIEKYKKLLIKFKVKNDDIVNIYLRAPSFGPREARIPVYVDYSNFSVNGKEIFSDTKTVWHNKPYKHSVNLKKGDVIEFQVNIQKTKFITYVCDCLEFDFYIFIILSCISILFISSVSKFIAKKNKTDAIFVVLFVILLFIPMINISDAEKSEQENRMLAKYQPLFTDGKLNEKYGSQFDTWFNDRFNGRNKFIKWYDGIRLNLSSGVIKLYGQCLNTSTKWIGRCSSETKMFSEEQLKSISRNLYKLKKFSDKNNIKFYILIAPSQGSIYGKQIDENYINKNEQESILQVIDYVKKHNNIDIVYPYKELLNKSRDDYVFFKTDTHWTDVAAFIGYKKVMDLVKKDFPDIKIENENDFDYIYSNKVKVKQDDNFHNGRNYKMLGLHDNSFFNSNYKYFIHKEKDKLNLSIDSSHGKEHYIARNFFFYKGKYNLTLFGDSFGENLEPIIPYSFKKTLRIYTWVPSTDLLYKNINIERFEKNILNNKTNVIILIFSDINRLMYLYKD